MSNSFDLRRFVDAQAAVYPQVVTESLLIGVGSRRRSAGQVIDPLNDQGVNLGRFTECDQTSTTDSERTPCAPWISTPSISPVADGPV